MNLLDPPYFLQGAFAYRLRHPQKELLAKAIGVKKNQPLIVIDATAGLGRDGFLLATLGCEVLLLERHSFIAERLQQALQQALQSPSYQHLKIKLLPIDARDYLQKLSKENYPDVIYLDPMFPERRKSALVKKEMQLLQALIGEDKDADELFTIALQRAKKRVVVKRPLSAPPLQNKPPHHSLKGKNTRFDVYY
jgi:16S rRNA (guanine1516-N2)-methyltransferase